MNNKMFFFVEQTPGTFVRDKTFWIKNSWSCMEEYRNVNNFCNDVRDRLDVVFQNKMGMPRAQNLSNQEKTALKFLQKNKNVNVIIINTDRNIGPACADKESVIKESKRQLYEKEFMHNLLKKRLTI